MSMNITIKLRTGRVREYPHTGAGGRTNTLRYEVGFVVVEDERGVRTSIPAGDVEEIIERPAHEVAT